MPVWTDDRKYNSYFLFSISYFLFSLFLYFCIYAAILLYSIVFYTYILYDLYILCSLGICSLHSVYLHSPVALLFFWFLYSPCSFSALSGISTSISVYTLQYLSSPCPFSAPSSVSISIHFLQYLFPLESPQSLWSFSVLFDVFTLSTVVSILSLPALSTSPWPTARARLSELQFSSDPSFLPSARRDVQIYCGISRSSPMYYKHSISPEKLSSSFSET